MNKKCLLKCEICSLPEGVPHLKLVWVNDEQGNYYSCQACILAARIEELYQELGQLINRQNLYLRSLARSYYKLK